MNDSQDDIAARLRRSLDGRGGAPDLSPDLVASAATRTAPRLTNPRRRLQMAGGAVLAIAALSVTAVVVTASIPRAPLFTATANSATALGAEADSTTDMRIGPWIEYRYTPGAGLSTEDGTGVVYQLRRAGSAEEALRRAAAALGVEGDPVESQYSDPAYPSYVVGPEDGSGPSVVISWSGTGNWWYNNPLATPVAACAAGEPATDEEKAREGWVCEAAEPTVADSVAPSEADARAAARALFAATGLDVAAEDIRVTVDAWQTVATANLRVDGVTTAIDWSIAWSASTGEIAWAYGHSIEVVERGSFGTVSAADAVGRLADWRWYGSGGPEYQGGMGILAADSLRVEEPGVADPGTTDPGTTDPGTTDPDAPVASPEEPVVPEETPSEEPSAEPEPAPEPDPSVEPEPAPEPAPDGSGEPSVEPEPLPVPEEPEVVDVTVDEAEATLLLMWDSEGNAWLVPGFAMPHPDGWWNTVVSLVEGVIQLPEPIEIEPYVID